MADFTKVDGQLINWSVLVAAASGAAHFVETSIFEIPDDIKITLHIDMCHKDTNDAADPAGVSVFIRSGTTNEDWHELCKYEATGGTALGVVLAAASGQGEANPDRIEVAATSNFQTAGDKYFLMDAGTLGGSCIVVNKGYKTNDYIVSMDPLLNAYDTSDYIYNIVDQWNIRVPSTVKAAKVIFWNTDADATYACRARYSKDTNIV